MIKKILFASFYLALPFLSFSPSKKDIKLSKINSYNLVQSSLKYSDLLRYIDPDTKLPKGEHIADKPYDFTFDNQGSYISKLYKFKDFNCSMFFAVDDMNYTQNDNEVEVKLHQYPKYVILEIPHLYHKVYIDEFQDGIDGKNEREYIGESDKNKTKINCLYDYLLVNEPNSTKKKIKLYEFLKEYLNPKTGLPNSDLLTEKPFEISYMGNRVNIAKNYLLKSDVNESNMNVDMTTCMLYFPVNDADFTDKIDKSNVLLKLSPNPLYSNITKSKYNPQDESITIQEDLWFIDLKMDSINGNELSEEEYLDREKNNKLEGLVI